MALTKVTSGLTNLDGGITIDKKFIDGTTMTLSSGDFTIDVAGDITFDAGGGDILLKDDNTLVGTIGGFSSNNVTIKSGIRWRCNYSRK